MTCARDVRLTGSDGLVNSGLPTILVSCKCDNPENTRQIDVASMESACLSCVETVKFASNVPESARVCLSSMLRAIMAHRNGERACGSYLSSSISGPGLNEHLISDLRAFPK